MNLPLVSIIIPFYNTEQSIVAAARSVLQQDYPAIELILVNDGSSDESLILARQLAAAYGNVKLLDLPHHSIGRARNEGLRLATGRYLAFLDSDDILEAGALHLLATAMKEADAHWVTAGFTICREHDAQGRQYLSRAIPESMTPRQAAACCCRQQIPRVVWAKLFVTRIAQTVSFPEGIWFEDGPYLLAYLQACTRPVVAVPALAVRHHTRPSSATRQLISSKRMDDTVAAMRAELRILDLAPTWAGLLPLVFGYYRSALADNLVMLAMDRQRVLDLMPVQAAFLQSVKSYSEEKQHRKVSSGPRTRLREYVLRLPQKVGWHLCYATLPLLLHRLFRKIRATRYG